MTILRIAKLNVSATLNIIFNGSLKIKNLQSFYASEIFYFDWIYNLNRRARITSAESGFVAVG